MTAAEASFKVGDVVKVSDRYGSLVLNSWAVPGTLLRVTRLRHDLGSDFDTPLVTAVAVDGEGRSVVDYGAGWFDLVERSGEGDQSQRRIEQLEAVVNKHQAYIEDQDERITALIREKTETEVKLSESRARFQSVKSQANEEIDRLLKMVNVRDSSLAEAVADRDALAATLTYALELLEPAQVQRVLGYQDGVGA